MGKLIFLDIDGTIAAPGQPPRESTIHAVRAARRNGHKVFLSTGRLEADIAENITAIGFDGGIYSAGGRVVVDGLEIVDRPIPAPMARQIIDTLKREDLFYMVEGAMGTYGSITGEIVAHGSDLIYTLRDPHPFQTQEQRELVERRLSRYKDVPAYKILVLAETAAQAEWLYETFQPDIKVVFFDKLSPDMPLIPGEITNQHVNKGTAFESICGYLDVSPQDCIAFGDSMNDAEILQSAGIGIAMGNAEPAVKEFADQICERWDEDGIAKALTRMNLI